MPTKVIQTQPGGLSLVQNEDGTTEWLPAEIASARVAASYDQGPVPEVPLPGPPGSDSNPMQFPAEAALGEQGPVPFGYDAASLPGPDAGSDAAPMQFNPDTVTGSEAAPMQFAPEYLVGSDQNPMQMPAESVHPPVADTRTLSPEEIDMPPQEFSGEELDAATATPAPASGVAPSQLQSVKSSGSVSVSRPVVRPGVDAPPAVPDFSPVLAMQAEDTRSYLQDINAASAATEELYRVKREGLEEVARVEREAMADHAELMRRAEEDTARYEADIQTALQQVPTMDPGRFWHDRSNFQKASGIFAAAMGGWLQVMKGGPNYAIEQFSRLIDQDIEAQKVDIETAREGVFRAERAYERGQQQISQRFGRLEEQRMFRIKALTTALDAEAMKYESPIAQMEFAKQRFALQSAFRENYASTMQQEYANRFNSWKAHQEAKRAQEQIRISRMNAQTARMAEKRQADEAKKGVGPTFIRDPNTGRQWLVGPDVAANMDKGAYDKLREGLSRDSSALSLVKEYVAKMQETGRAYGGWGKSTRFAPKAEELANLGQLREKAINAIRHATAGANLTGFELANWEKILPNPTTKTSQDAVDDAANFVRLHGEEAQRKYANTYGLMDVGPNGELTPVDLTRKWGTVDLKDTEAPDAAELYTRLQEQLRGIELETPAKRPDSFIPSEPPRKAGDYYAYTGEGPRAKSTVSDTYRAALQTAETLRNYAGNVPEETGVTPDLVNNIIRELVAGSNRLERSGQEFEAGRFLELASELKELNVERIKRQQFNEEAKADQGQELPIPGGGVAW